MGAFRARLGIAVLFIAMGVSISTGQELETIHIPAPVLLESRLHLPSGASEHTVPLIIGLHGGGSTPESMGALWERVRNPEFAFLALKAPYAIPEGDEGEADWAMWPSADPALMKRAASHLPSYIRSAISEVKRRISVGNVYLLGFSQGAVYSYIVGVAMPEELAGLVILSGPGLESPIHTPFTAEPALPNWIGEGDLTAASGLRVFLAHGRSDQAADFSLAEESYGTLTRLGYDVVFRAFEGGHELPPDEVIEEMASWIVFK